MTQPGGGGDARSGGQGGLALRAHGNRGGGVGPGCACPGAGLGDSKEVEWGPGCARPGMGLGGGEGDWGPGCARPGTGLGGGKGVEEWARGARGRSQAGSAGARAQPRRRAETRPGRAQSARRRAPRARAASRGAARVAQVEAGAGAGATPGLKFQSPG